MDHVINNCNTRWRWKLLSKQVYKALWKLEERDCRELEGWECGEGSREEEEVDLGLWRGQAYSDGHYKGQLLDREQSEQKHGG